MRRSTTTVLLVMDPMEPLWSGSRLPRQCTGARTCSCVHRTLPTSEVGGDSEGTPELGHVVAVTVGRLVALVEMGLLIG